MDDNSVESFIEFNPFELKIIQNKMDIIEKECVAAGDVASKIIPPPIVYASLAGFAYIAGMQAVLELYSPTMIRQNVYDQINELNSLIASGETPSETDPDNVIQLKKPTQENPDG